LTSAAAVAAERAPTPDPIDWALAQRVARRIAGRDPLTDSYLAASLRDDFAAVTHQAEELVADYTGRTPLTYAGRTLLRDQRGFACPARVQLAIPA